MVAKQHHRIDAVTLLHWVYLFAITSNPFRFGHPDQMGQLIWEVLPLDLAANVVLLVPLGLALRATGRSPWTVLALGAVTSLSIEALQLFNSRASSLIDLGLNSLGIAGIAFLPGLNRAGFGQALIMTPALWSVGLLWPRLPVECAVAGLGVLLWVSLAARVWPRARFPFALWLLVSCAPAAANAPVSATAAAFVAGALAASGRAPDERWARRGLVTLTLGALIVVGTVPAVSYWAGPFDVWRGHALIWLGTLVASTVLFAPPGPGAPTTFASAQTPLYSTHGQTPPRLDSPDS